MSDDVLIDAGPLVALIRYTRLMAMLSIRLDARTASTVDRVAAQTGKTKSEIVREALAKYAEEVDKLLGEKVDKKSASERPYDKAKHLIGAGIAAECSFPPAPEKSSPKCCCGREMSDVVLVDAARSSR